MCSYKTTYYDNNDNINLFQALFIFFGNGNEAITLDMDSVLPDHLWICPCSEMD